MTNEKMLKHLYEIKSSLNCGTWKPIDDAIAEVVEDIRRDAQKKKGVGKRDSVLRKMMKICEKNHRHEGYSKVGDMYGFLDGYRAYVLNDNFGYKECEHMFSFESIRPKRTPDHKAIVDMADLTVRMKEINAMKRNAKDFPYEVKSEDGLTAWFNPKFLIEFCQMFGNEIYFNDELSPAYAENEIGEWGVVLPIRRNW